MFTGVHTAIITPFVDGQIDLEAFEYLVNRQVEAGVHGIVPCGTTGESATLTDDEILLLIKHTIDVVDGRCAVIAGVGTNDTARTIRLATTAQKLGADGGLVITPYYNKPGQNGLYAHCSAVAEAVPALPIVLYNVPSRTGVSFSIDTIVRLSEQANIVAIKDATADMAFASQICTRTASDFKLLSGDDITALPLWAVGGQGVVSVASNLVPRQLVALWNAFDGGRLSEARGMHHKLLPLFDGLFIETNPVPVKYLTSSKTGRCRPDVRLPLTTLLAATKARLDHVFSTIDEEAIL